VRPNRQLLLEKGLAAPNDRVNASQMLPNHRLKGVRAAAKALGDSAGREVVSLKKRRPVGSSHSGHC